MSSYFIGARGGVYVPRSWLPYLQLVQAPYSGSLSHLLFNLCALLDCRFCRLRLKFVCRWLSPVPLFLLTLLLKAILHTSFCFHSLLTIPSGSPFLLLLSSSSFSIFFFLSPSLPSSPLPPSLSPLLLSSRPFPLFLSNAKISGPIPSKTRLSNQVMAVIKSKQGLTEFSKCNVIRRLKRRSEWLIYRNMSMAAFDDANQQASPAVTGVTLNCVNICDRALLSANRLAPTRQTSVTIENHSGEKETYAWLV